MNILKILTDRRIKGNLGERAAEKFLKKKRYKILERNFVGGTYEIDLIAKDGDTTVFAEVKTRSISAKDQREPRPASSVTPDKQKKLISASKFFMKKERLTTKMRYDVIEVFLENKNGKDEVIEIKHLISAFDFNTAYDKNFNHSN